MHRRGLDNVLAKLGSKIELTFFIYLIYKDTHALTCPLDVTARGIVTAFNHHGKTHDQVIVHAYDVLRLLLYFES